MSFVLEVQDWNSQAIEANLDNLLYYIILDWNDSGQYWTMAIRNSAYGTLIDGIALSPNYPLTYQFRYAGMPPGELVAQNVKPTNGPIPRDGFSSGNYQLVYTTEQEMLDAGNLEIWGKTSGVV